MQGMVTSIRGNIESFKDGIDEFDEMDTSLPFHLTIPGLVKSITATKSPMETSIAFASSHRTRTILPNLQGFTPQLHATVAQSPANRRGGRRSYPPRPRRSSNFGIVCRACHMKNHEEVECRQLARWLILSGRANRLPSSLKKKVLDNYYNRYSTMPPSPSVNRSCAQHLSDFCSERGLTEDEVSDCFAWEWYAEPDVDDGPGGGSFGMKLPHSQCFLLPWSTFTHQPQHICLH